MIIRPSLRKPHHFVIDDVHPQELENLLEAMENPEPVWRWNNPWGRGVIQQLRDAVEAGKTYYFGSSW